MMTEWISYGLMAAMLATVIALEIRRRRR